MTRNYGVLVLLAIVLIGVTGCPTSDINSNPTLTEINANYTGTMTIYPDTPLDNLKSGLTVTATYSNNTSNILSATDYTLSGTLTEGTSTITVTHRDKTATFTVKIPTESPSMQVYKNDKTSLYDGENLDFYIQGDTDKKITATIRDGMLVITYNPLPESCQLLNITQGLIFTNPTNTTEGLQYYEIVLTVVDGTKRLYYRLKNASNTARQVRIIYFNMDDSFKAGNASVFEYSVKQGWNFIFQGAWTDPEHFEDDYCWVVEQQ